MRMNAALKTTFVETATQRSAAQMDINVVRMLKVKSVLLQHLSVEVVLETLVIRRKERPAVGSLAVRALRCVKRGNVYVKNPSAGLDLLPSVA